METLAKMESQSENLKILDQLRSYLRQGFLLHGSKQLVKILEPRQASDNDPNRTTGKAHAVYAETMDPRIPIVMALFDKKDPGLRGWTSGYHSSGPDSTMTITGTNCTFTAGYVYVLPPDNFQREGSDDDFEFISATPVTPIAVIKVDPSMLGVLDGIKNEIDSYI
jgi:hypothetical protein